MEGLNQIETSTVMTIRTLNNQKGALQDVRVRQAMNYAINKETIINDILGGCAQKQMPRYLLNLGLCQYRSLPL